jgi:type II secretory pathway pseudopilin PulG
MISMWPTPLVVIAIIAMAALLLPALSHAKRSALSAACPNNQKQLQLALILQAGDNNDKMPPNDRSDNAGPAPPVNR